MMNLERQFLTTELKMSQAKNNKLKKNFNAWAIFSLINNAKLLDKTVVGWRMIGGKKVTVELKIRIIRKFRNEMVIRVTEPRNRNTLGNLISGSDRLNVFLSEDLVLFQSDVKKADENGDVTISIPKMIAQIDRRKHLRLFVEEGLTVHANFFKSNHAQKTMKQQFAKTCFDVSAGGLSFVISKMERRYFGINDMVNNIRLTMNHEVVDLTASVVNILEVEPDPHNGLHYKGWKVCLAYTKPKAEQVKLINDFVFKYIEIDEAI